MCYFLIHWPPGGALLRQQHSLINSGPHTGPLSRLFWECRRCTYYNPKLNPNFSSVCGMACYSYLHYCWVDLSASHFRCTCLSWLYRLIPHYLLILFISPWAGISHTSIRLTLFICCLCILSHVRTGLGRNDNQAGPSSYKGKEKAL